MAAAFVALVSGFIASWWHRLGTRVLPTLGVILAGGIVGVIFRDARAGSDINVWPAMLGGIAFFYLWWLGALLFDLVFVWHRYIRHAAAMQRVGEIARSGYQPPPTVRLATQTVDSTVRLASQTADSAKNCAQYVANQSVRCASLVKGLTSRDNRKDDPPTS
jgi:prepilin signal peptidase PulO-like enzyme (type II secretory pathway)